MSPGSFETAEIVETAWPPPLPVRDPGELVRLAIDLSETQTDSQNAPLNLPIIEAIQRQSHSFHDLFGWCVYDFPFKDGSINSGRISGWKMP